MMGRVKGQLLDRTGTQPTDDRLMESLAAGNISSLAEIYMRYGRMARIAIRRFAPEIPEAEAEELGQEVFLGLEKTARRYRGNGLKPWIYGIAVNKARSWRRSTWLRRKLLERHHRDRVGLFAVRQTAPDAEVEYRQEVQRALESLPPPQREVLLLHAIEGFTGEEIARILRIRPKTVWTRLHRARRAMVASLEGDALARARGGEER